MMIAGGLDWSQLLFEGEEAAGNTEIIYLPLEIEAEASSGKEGQISAHELAISGRYDEQHLLWNGLTL
tara:strand:+ start:32135 stop:32338 length:204 start_codon:yes stop_codon:yes gene_type:complete